MAVVSEPIYRKEYSCVVSDLVDGFPPSTTYVDPEGVEKSYELGSLMFAYDSTTKDLIQVFTLTNPSGTNVWYKVT